MNTNIRLFLLSLVVATVSPASAENVSKTFEFGAGTPQPRSHVRTFNIPCGTAGGVAAVVKYRRLGPGGASNDIPIIIEFREPDTAPDQEGPIIETKTATAKTTEQTVVLRSQSSNRGCDLPWRVRVRYANEGTAPVQAFGSIRIDFDGTSRDIEVEVFTESLTSLKRGASLTRNVGGSAGVAQGRIEVTARWHHAIGIVKGGNVIKLRFQLIDPNGTLAKTAEGYSSDETGLPKLKLTYQVPKCASGQWKLKITNIDANDDVYIYRPIAKLTPSCP